jgi:hypothetical protein
MAALALGWAALPLFTSSAAAEATWLPPPIQVQGLQPVDFQNVWAGVNASVSRTDPLRAGILTIKGTGNNEIIMTFQLPSMLQGPSGALMPIVFGANDAGYAVQNNPGQAVGFNPHSPHINKLHGAKGFVFLGGTVSPQLGQTAGAYQAPVTLTVAYTGN